MGKKRRPNPENLDWERIRQQYRAGVLSIREIGRQHGVTDSAIRQMANKRGWERDLTTPVRERTWTKLLRTKLRTPQASDNEIIEEAADLCSSVVLVHRDQLRELRRHLGLAFADLAAISQGLSEFQQMIDQLAEQEQWSNRQVQRAYKALSLETRASVFNGLVGILAQLQELEARAYGLGQTSPASDLSRLKEELLASAAS